MRLVITFLVASVIVASGCSADERPTEQSAVTEPTDRDQLFPDVIDATATQAADGTWAFEVTLSSPYDTPERYADAWRVLAPNGALLGVRELAHDHAGEQPFTRSLSDVEIYTTDVGRVTVEGRDQVNGWGGDTVEVTLKSALQAG